MPRMLHFKLTDKKYARLMNNLFKQYKNPDLSLEEKQDLLKLMDDLRDQKEMQDLAEQENQI